MSAKICSLFWNSRTEQALRVVQPFSLEPFFAVVPTVFYSSELLVAHTLIFFLVEILNVSLGGPNYNSQEYLFSYISSVLKINFNLSCLRRKIR